MLKPLPTTTATFRDIIEGGFLYIDKTESIYKLISPAKGAYFLARPRRFGKSLLLSTLAEVFSGNRELFRGLWLYSSDYDWQIYPIIRLNFSQSGVKNAEHLEQLLDYYLKEIARSHGLKLTGVDCATRFGSLIQQMAGQSNTSKHVVILIDEYDKPITDTIERIEEAKRVRDVLRNFYTVIKAMDEYIRFVLITGISKFSKVGIFSMLNNLDDMTMDPAFATALGITEAELHRDFAPYLTDVTQQMGLTQEALLQKVERWYNGFRFVENAPRVYNPYSTLLLFKKRRFSNYWFESGTPAFLINLIKQRNYDVQDLQTLEVTELDFSTYELEDLAIIPLLFQSGYLTIHDFHQDGEDGIYKLGYPNYEVEQAFTLYLLSGFSGLEHSFSRSYLRLLVSSLRTRNFAKFFSTLNAFFANIDYDLYIRQEKYYQTIFYLIFLMIGLQVSAEVKTNDGRIDGVIELEEHLFLFEFKLDSDAQTALKQIKDHEYYQKYALIGKPITLVGANFDSSKRKVTDYKVGKVDE